MGGNGAGCDIARKQLLLHAAVAIIIDLHIEIDRRMRSNANVAHLHRTRCHGKAMASRDGQARPWGSRRQQEIAGAHQDNYMRRAKRNSLALWNAKAALA